MLNLNQKICGYTLDLQGPFVVKIFGYPLSDARPPSCDDHGLSDEPAPSE